MEKISLKNITSKVDVQKIKDWTYKNRYYIYGAVGAYVLYRVVKYFTGSEIEKSMSNIPFSKNMEFPRLMEVIVSHEAKTYDDHNWYANGANLRGYIKGVSSYRYPLLTKDLSKYTVGEVMAFQSRSRDASGQLWATGLYQIIPPTLRGTIASAGVKTTDVYDTSTQDKLGMALLRQRPNLWAYLTGAVADTEKNVNAAAMDIAKTWSSVGVPYAGPGARMYLQRGQSYYHGGGDRAATSPDDIIKALRLSRRKK